MAQIVGKYAAKKMLGKQMDKYKKKDVTPYDPYYEMIPHPRKKGKFKKVKRQIPDYIPEHDAVILAKMRQRAYWLDCSLFNLAGVRFGWSSVIGLIPAAGDGADALLAFMLYWRCTRVECKLDTTTQFLMLLNIAIDFLVGLVPIVGDLADAAIRANSKNVRLLEKRLDKVYKPKALEEKERKDGLPHTPATVYEEFSDDDDQFLPRHRQDVEPRRPEPVRVPTETRGGERVDPSRNNSRRHRQDDVEAYPSRSSTKKSGRHERR